MSSAPRIQDRRPFNKGENCPACGTETEVGYGLAGGGFGPYTYCAKCETITSKSPDEDVDFPVVADDGERH